MTPADRQELEALRVEVRELREEVAEYRALERGEAADIEALTRLDDLTRLFGSAPAYQRHARMAARAVLTLLGAGGKVVRLERLLEAVRVNRDHEPGLNLARQAVTVARYHLRRFGLDQAIQLMPRHGYRLSPVYLARIEALIAQRAAGVHG